MSLAGLVQTSAVGAGRRPVTLLPAGMSSPPGPRPFDNEASGRRRAADARRPPDPIAPGPMPVSRLIPSMFHRRLALLMSLVVVGMAPLAGQMFRLTVVKGDEHRAAAERALVRRKWTPTVRGQILDRKGRILATDRPAFDVAVDYRLITGEWASDEAAAAARAANRERWLTLDAEGRERLTAERLPIYQARLDAFWRTFAQTAGLSEDDINDRRARIMSDVQRTAAIVWERALKSRQRDLSSRSGPDSGVTLSDVARPIREQRQPHVVLRGVDDSTAFEFRRQSLAVPGLHVNDAGQREYPHETMSVSIDRSRFPVWVRSDEPAVVTVSGVGAHVLGWMRTRVFAEDIARRPLIDPRTGEVDRGGYQPGDAVGQAGVERDLEQRLRGLRGQTVQRLDTGSIEETPAEPGQTVRLTIDIALQARIQALMSPELGLAAVQPWHGGKSQLPEGAALNGAAVVLDVATGEVLALVSTPTFTRAQIESDPDLIFRDPLNNPWANRATNVPYPPGSIIKPMMLVAAVAAGKHNIGAPIECTGHFLPGRTDLFRCWIYKQYHTTHNAQLGHDLAAPEALAVSCNIYFYTVGRRLGPDGMNEWARRFGIGSTPGLHAGPEHPGFIGAIGSGAITPSDSIHMGIGQGPIAWTPPHSAAWFASFSPGRS
ncbi:MAG: hypothetical protein IBJ10_11985, partial [Phycisphaerales bacterium]|nr:hypothetical protein [Phycisphaerales bacterium]